MAAKKNKSVLIADDQEELREVLADKLHALGKEVIAFSSGRRLLGHLQDAAVDVELVVLDLDFGVGEPDGIEILKGIKEKWDDLPVIILTGKGSIDAAVEAVQYGAADFIEKDFYVEDKLELGMDKVERMLAVLRENARLRPRTRHSTAKIPFTVPSLVSAIASSAPVPLWKNSSSRWIRAPQFRGRC